MAKQRPAVVPATHGEQPRQHAGAPDVPTSQLTRRDLMAAAAGMVTAGCAGTSPSWETKRVATKDGIIDLDIADFPELATAGGMVALSADKVKQPILVMRIEHDNFRAMSLRCPHLGCTVRWDNAMQQLLCPCHKSTFSDSGRVTKGPAQQSLQQFQVQFLGMAGAEGGTQLRIRVPKD